MVHQVLSNSTCAEWHWNSAIVSFRSFEDSIKEAMSVPVCPPDSLCCKIKRWTQTLSETTSMHGLAWYNRLDLLITFFLSFYLNSGNIGNIYAWDRSCKHSSTAFALENILLAPGFKPTTMSSCLGSTFLTGICISPIDHFAPIGSLYSGWPRRGHENCYCSHLLHYPEHVLPIE